MRRWAVVGVVAALAGPVMLAPAPAVGQTAPAAQLTDPMSSSPPKYLNQHVAPSGHVWQAAASPDNRLYRATAGLVMGSSSTYGLWSRGYVTMPGPDGEMSATISYSPSSEQLDTQVGQAASLVFRSSGADLLEVQFKCEGNASGTGGFVVGTKNQTGVPLGVAAPGPACGTVIEARVTWQDDEYQAYVDGVQVWSYDESLDGSTGVNGENTTIGVGIYHGNQSGAGGLVISGLSAHVAPPGAAINSPYYACGRTIRDVGGGQFFVDLEAANLTDEAVDSLTAVDRGHEWRTSWGVARPTPTAATSESTLTLALPPLSEMPEGGWTATFYVWRDRLVDTGRFDSEQFSGGDFERYDADGPGAEPTLWWWVPTEVHEVFNRLPAHWKGEIVGESYLWDESDGDRDHWLAEMGVGVIDSNVQVNGGDFPGFNGGDFDSLRGTCTVTINPARPGDGSAQGTTGPAPVNICPSGGTTTTTIAACSTVVTTIPKSDPGTQGQDGEKQDCSAGFLGRIPLIGGAFDLTARLVCALKQILVELFIPDDLGAMFDLGEYSTRFPASWVSEGTESVTSLQGSISTAAGGSVCGPVMNLPQPMSMTVRFPGPAGCGPTAAGASASNDSAAFNLHGYRGGIRALLKLFLYLGVTWRLIRLAPWAGDKDDGAPTFDH